MSVHGKVSSETGDLAFEPPEVSKMRKSFDNYADLRSVEMIDIHADKHMEKMLRDKLALHHRSLFIFSKDNKIRVFVFRLTHHRLFEALVIILIFANCFFLAMDDPTKSESEQPPYLLHMEYFFTAVFAFEMCLKVFGQGFVLHEGSYLRNGWNVLDFFIVTLSFLAFLPFFGNYSAIRMLRVLRPLRSINGIQGLKNIVNGLLYSVKKLVNVLALGAFLFFIFGIIGVQLWAGLFQFRCQECYRGDGERCTAGNETDEGQLLMLPNVSLYDPPRYCKRGATSDGFNSIWGRPCEEGYVCVDTDENPNYGYTSFDYIGAAFLAIFQCITMEGWTDIMYIVQDVWGNLGWIYFVMLVVLGSFFVLNLALAVINEQFNTIRAETEKEHQEAIERMKGALALAQATLGGDNISVGDALYVRDMPSDPWRLGIVSGFIDADPVVKTGDGFEKVWFMYQLQDEEEMTDVTDDVEMEDKASQVLGQSGIASECRHSVNRRESQRISFVPKERKSVIVVEKKRGPLMQVWLKLRWTCFWIVKWRYFQPFIITCIVVNTALLASEHHQQPRQLTKFLDTANVVLTMIFTVEMLLKLLASGFKGYVEDPFNVLDGAVVIMSIVEFAFSGSSTVSVFRALRLLRVFKLLKNFPGLRKLITVCLSAIRDTGYLNSIILLYIFIAALVGMQFFGGKFYFPDRDEPKPRATFDSFYWSFLSVFQILTRDDWVVIMWDAMLGVGSASCMYFLVLVVCGDFLILNLFLAILIQSFDSSMSSNVEDDCGTESDDEVAPPEAPNREDRKRQSLMSNPVMKRASVLFNIINKEDMQKQSVKDIKVSLKQHNSWVHLQHQQAAYRRASMLENNDLMDENKTEESESFVNNIAPLPTAGTPRSRRSSIFEDMSGPFFSSFYRGVSIPLPPKMGFIEYCNECGDTYMNTHEEAKEAHINICSLVQLRKLRQHRVREVFFSMREVGYTTRVRNEKALGMLWEVGLLLDQTLEEWGYLTITDVCQILDEQNKVLQLRIGEEVVGGSLVNFVTANKPRLYKTNGGNSLCLFGESNWFRLMVCKIVKDPRFENLILVCIIVSSLLMAMENPRQDLSGTTLGDFLYVNNMLFTSIFVVEMMLKLVAFGLIFGKSHPDSPYLRDSWNIMDGIIVIVSVLSIALASSTSNLSFLKVFRTFRALRPLRVISRNVGLRMVVITLMQSMWGIGNVAVISLLVFLVFGILGVQLLAGKLYYCTDTTINFQEACYGWYVDPSTEELVMRMWKNKSRQHFDNIFRSLLTLFEISTLELWSTIMYESLDAVNKREAPRRDNNMFYGIFFVAFVIVGAFFILNLFVGVVIHNYNEVKVKEDGLHFLSEEQKLWIETQRMMLNFKPIVKMRVPQSENRKNVYYSIRTPYFELTIGVCVFLNVLLMSFEYHDMPPNFRFVLEVGNYFFSGVFFIEASMKIIAYGLSYFKDPWNRFDFFLVLLSMLDVFLAVFRSTGLPVNTSLLRVFKIFRIMRILRLVKAAKDVRVLLETVWYSLPSIANIGGFLGLLFFIYGILGVNLFAQVKQGEYLTYHANFETFPNAILLLFRMVTGENWNGVMHDTMVTAPDCGNDTRWNDCGDPETAPLYYVSFLLMAGFVLTNLFVAIILDNFGTTMQLEKSELRLNDLHRFIEIWADFDPTAELTIRTLLLPTFLERLGPPLGISRRTSRVEILKRTRNYCIPEHGGVIHFIETIIPLARHCMNEKWQDSTEHKDLRDQEDSWRQAFPDINDLPVLRVRQRRATVDHYFASTYIAAAYRRRRAREVVYKMRVARNYELTGFYLTQVWFY